MSPEVGSPEAAAASSNGADPLRMPDGALVAKRDAPVGGQAVLEGVMMRGVSVWAVAVRNPEGEIEISSEPIKPWAQRHRLWRLPVLRGVVALGESMKIGFRALAISANAQLEEDEEGEPEEIGGWVWGLTIALSLALAVGLFFVIPVGLTSLIKDQLGSPLLFWLVEGVLRTAIFIGYIVAISRLRDLRRVFEYHGAEHKTISCYEAEDELTPARAKLYSRLHPRCGTSFLLIVMVLAIFVFAPIGLPAWYWLLASRILGIPLIAGLSYEVIKWAGKNRRKRWVRAVMWPGLMLQNLTTREPDEEQLAVAIAALEKVLAEESPEAAAAEPADRDRRLGSLPSRRCSKASAAALAPPAAANACGDPLGAGAAIEIASRTLERSRSGLSSRAGSRVPAPDLDPRRATSNWSRPKGTTQTGTPSASAFWVAPMPPWVIAQLACSSTGRVGDEREHGRVTGRRAGRSVLAAGSVATTWKGSPASAVERRPHEPAVVLEIGRGRHEHEWRLDRRELGGQLGRAGPRRRARPGRRWRARRSADSRRARRVMQRAAAVVPEKTSCDVGERCQAPSARPRFR